MIDLRTTVMIVALIYYLYPFSLSTPFPRGTRLYFQVILPFSRTSLFPLQYLPLYIPGYSEPRRHCNRTGVKSQSGTAGRFSHRYINHCISIGVPRRLRVSHPICGSRNQMLVLSSQARQTWLYYITSPNASTSEHIESITISTRPIHTHPYDRHRSFRKYIQRFRFPEMNSIPTTSTST